MPSPIRQREEVVERIPILRMGAFLLVTIQVDMHDRLAMALQDDLTNRVTETSARGVLIDISALEIVDSFIGRMIANISAMARVLDAETVVVGMQPGRRHYARRTGSVAARRPDRPERREGHGASPRRSDIGYTEEEAMAVAKNESLPVAHRDATWSWSARRCANGRPSWDFSLVDQTKVVTAASELARNTLVHGGGGGVRLEGLSEGVRKGLRMTFEDKGPGIADIELALRDGYTTGCGLGLGLGGVRRLVNEFDIDSRDQARAPVSP